jgi:ABC-2 type transport system permease protein
MPTKTKFSLDRLLFFNLPLLVRTCYDYWLTLLVATGTLVGFHWLAVTFLPAYNLKYRLGYIRRMPPFVKAMFGPDLMSITSMTAINSFAYIHPVTLAILMAVAVIIPSWMLVGQIDRGTVELTLSTPISRKKIVFTTILIGLISGAVLCAGMLLGTWIGIGQTKLPEPIAFKYTTLIALNLYAIYILCMSVSVLASSITSLRGTAVGVTMAFCVGAYLIHFMAEWWKFIEKISFLGPLYYFRPIKIAAGTYNPTQDILILLGVSAVLMFISTIWFSRRDIAVV